MRVALYARVSTRDKDQNLENQLVLLRREAERAGDTIVKEYVDVESGGKAMRKQFQQLMRDAEKRQFDLMRAFALDRFSSEGIEAVFEHTARLDQCGVAVWSYCESMLDTTRPMAALCKAIIAGPPATATSATPRTCAWARPASGRRWRPLARSTSTGADLPRRACWPRCASWPARA